MTLTFDRFTVKVCGRSGVTWSCIVCSKFNRNRTTLGWVIHNLATFCSRYVSLWPWPLTPWPWTFVILPASCVQTLYKIWAKSHNLRQSYWPFSTFSPSSSRGWGNSPDGSQGCMDWTSPNLAWKQGDHGRVTSLFQSWDILLHFTNAGASKLSKVENDAKFRTFWPL